MALRQNLALNAAPLVLRVALAVTFLWAGLAKLTQKIEVAGEDAARLANMGVTFRAAAPATTPSGDPAPEVPIDPPASRATDPAPAIGLAMIPPFTLAQIEPVRPTPAGSQPDPAPSGAPSGGATTTVQAGPVKTAADFPNPVEVRQLYGIALLIGDGAAPSGVRADGTPLPATVPSVVVPGASSRVPIYLAWLAALTELLAGGAMLVGLLTRIAGLALAGTMLTAIWLTTSGPAWQAGTATLGIIPGHAAFDASAWSTPLWQLACLAMSLAVFFTGAGALSFDRMLFTAPGEAKPSRPAARPEGK